jgi:hypothetical protein
MPLKFYLFSLTGEIGVKDFSDESAMVTFSFLAAKGASPLEQMLGFVLTAVFP